MKLNGLQKTGYGIGAVGKDIAYAFVAGFLLYYYNDLLGISGTFVGLVMMAARLFDAFNDPFMGAVVEKTKTPFGKFRPWMLTGTVVNALIIYALFAVPVSLSGTGLMVYFAIGYFVWGITYTLMDIPFWSMIPAITSPGKERENLSVIGRTCAAIGYALPTVVTMGAVLVLGSTEREGFAVMGLFVAIAFVVAQLICVFTVREKTSSIEKKSPTLKEMFTSLVTNDQALAVVIGITIFNASIYITAQLAIYFFKYDIGNSALYGIFGIVGGVAQVLGMVTLPILRKKFSGKMVLTMGALATILGYLLLFGMGMAGINNVLLISIPAFIIYLGFGILTVLTTIFLANTVDYGEKKTGQRIESVIFSMQTFVVKLASAFSIFIAGISIDLIGLQTSEEDIFIQQSSSTLLGLRVIMLLVPMIGIAVSLLFMRKKYTLNDAISTVEDDNNVIENRATSKAETEDENAVLLSKNEGENVINKIKNDEQNGDESCSSQEDSET